MDPSLKGGRYIGGAIMSINEQNKSIYDAGED